MPQGKITFWNRDFGFIEKVESKDSFFFSKSSLVETPKDVQLFSKVSFEITDINSGKHAGGFKAIRVRVLETTLNERKEDLKSFHPVIARVKYREGNTWILSCPIITDNLPIRLFSTRVIDYSGPIEKHQLFIVGPVNSTKTSTELFAYYAYPLSIEKDVDFLNEMVYPEIERNIVNHIQHIKLERGELDLEQIFTNEIELAQKNYSDIKAILLKYKHEDEFTPNSRKLSELIGKALTIQLYEGGLISEIATELLLEHFLKTNAENKRNLTQGLSKDQFQDLMELYFDHLENYFLNGLINNHVKTFLDIQVRRNSELSNDGLTRSAEELIIKNSNPKDVINLWLKGYIEHVPNTYLKAHLAVEHLSKSVISEKRKDFLSNYLKNEIDRMIALIRKTNSINAIEDLCFAIRLGKDSHIIEKTNSTDSDNYFSSITDQLLPIHKFYIWVQFEGNWFEGLNYLKNNWSDIDIYYRLEVLSKHNRDIEKVSGYKIDRKNLLEYIATNPWSGYREPIKNQSEGFIPYFKSTLEFLDLDHTVISDVSELIFETIQKSSVYPSRMWLERIVGDDKFDLVDFRDGFFQLSSDEQKRFRMEANRIGVHDIVQDFVDRTVPCKEFIETTDGQKYLARLENIFFDNRELKLKLEDETYTNPYKFEQSSFGLNRISVEHEFGSQIIHMEVKDSEIREIQGLNDLLDQIRTSEILRDLINPIRLARHDLERKEAYPEDWGLREKVLEYLRAQHLSEYQVKVIKEPSNDYFNRDKAITEYAVEKVEIFSIKARSGILLVWENIDLTESRATYLFLVNTSNYHDVIEHLAQVIAELVQLRSILSSRTTEKDPNSKFKKSLGYVGSIRKRRGRSNAFERWLKRLDQYRNARIDTETDINLLNNEFEKILDNVDAPVKAKVRRIKRDEFLTVDENFGIKAKPEKNATLNINRLEIKRTILNALEELNSQLWKELKTK